MTSKTKATVLALAAAVSLSACGGSSVSPSQTALHYGGGILEAQEFKDCLQSSERDNFAPGDNFYTYQTDVRSYNATGQGAFESGPIEVLSSEKEVVRIPVTISFRLKSDCESLQSFHENIGSKDWHEGKGAYNEDGSPGQGWTNFLNHVFNGPLNTTLDSLSEEQTFNALIGDDAVRTTLEETIKTDLPSQIAKRTGGKQYFEGFEVQVNKPTLANQAILDAISQQNAAVEQGRAAEAKAQADGKAAIATAEAERLAAAKRAEAANAQVEVARAEAAVRQAEIAGYGGVDGYNDNQAIQKGLNPKQPTYIVGGTQPK